MPKPDAFKCPLGDPKVVCEHIQKLHFAVSRMNAESIQKDMSIKEIESHLIFVKDRIEDLLVRVRRLLVVKR